MNVLEKITKDGKIKATMAPEIRQQLMGRGKSIQVIVMNQVIGDSAIDKVSAENGDVKAAMKYILRCLPKPKIQWLRWLAIAVALEDGVTHRELGHEFGVSRHSFIPSSPNREYIDMILEGKIAFDPPEGVADVVAKEETVRVR